MSRLPSFKSIEAFVVAARSLSFTATAIELNLTVPAVSRRIQALEAELGVALFEREHRAVELTAAGKAYAAKLEPVIEALRHAGDSMRAAQGRDSLRISVRPCFASSWLFGRLHRFTERHRDIAVEFKTSPHELALGGFDVGIRLCDDSLQNPPPGLQATRLLDLQAFPVCSPAYAKRHRAGAGPAAVAEHRLLGSRHLGSLWPQWLASHAIRPPRGLRLAYFDNLVLAYEAAAGGLGVALGLDALVEPYIEQGRLQRLGDAARGAGYKVCTFVRQQDGARLEVQAFVEWIHEEAAAWRQRASLACASSDRPQNSIAECALPG